MMTTDPVDLMQIRDERERERQAVREKAARELREIIATYSDVWPADERRQLERLLRSLETAEEPNEGDEGDE